MPEIAFMTVSDIEGESNVRDQDGKIEVLAFQHEVSKEVDPLDCSKVRSDRRHGQASVIKLFDKATPLLNQALCEGATVDEIKIEWYRQPDGAGSPEHYFTHTFTKCIITAVRPVMPNALSPENKPLGHMESVEWGYKQLTWTSESGGTEFTDDVRQ